MAVGVQLAACCWQRDPQQKSSLLEVLDNDKVVTRKMISLRAAIKEHHRTSIPRNPAYGGVQKFVHPKDIIDFKQVR